MQFAFESRVNRAVHVRSMHVLFFKKTIAPKVHIIDKKVLDIFEVKESKIKSEEF